ncbi:MAG: hypothetical protein QXG03_11135 [Halalkalicoccus sp.]
MSVVPGDLDTDRQPPMTVPLGHFVLACCFLLAAVAFELAVRTGLAPAFGSLATVHLLLVGWICLTIMGAMTQFVPVWSGTRLHSRRLAAVQLWLVSVGLLGFAGGLLAERLVVLPAAGTLLIAGFWTFVYNVGRTLRTVSGYDVTERHFALALGFFLVVTGLGGLLALDFVRPVFAPLSVSRPAVLSAHATLAVFGAVLTTVFGALYQLATMFTRTEFHGIDRPLRRFEVVCYPPGVLALAGGRLIESSPLARVGGLLVVLSVLGFGVLLGRRLFEARVEPTPMLSRYAVAAGAMALWATLTLPTWLRDPLASDALLGAPGTRSLLLFGVVGFVVLGTLYHVVPFIVWVHRYSDRLGYEAVPMIDDLYDGRLAAADFWLLSVGTLALADRLALSPTVSMVGALLALCGAALFSMNLLGVVRAHSPHSVFGALVGALTAGSERPAADGDPAGTAGDGSSD